MARMTKAGYIPERDVPKKAPKEKKLKPPKKRRRRLNPAVIVSLIVFMLALAIGAAALYIYVQVEDNSAVFCRGLTLSGYPLGGLTALDGAKLLERQTGEAIAGWSYTITCQGRTYTITAEDIGLSVDQEQTLDALWQVGKQGNLFERYAQILRARSEGGRAEPVLIYTMEPVDAMLAKAKEETDRQPVDATVTYVPGSSEPFRFTADSLGYELDTEPLRTQIAASIHALKSGEATAEPTILKPSVTQSQLSGAIVVRGFVRMTLEQDSGALANAQLAADVLNGYRIEAGRTFSFNEAVGRRTAEGGYVDAPESAYGSYIYGVGGGVCQISSALYQAALLGGIQVDERNAAIYPVPYCDPGLEAAVSDQGLDLRLTNTTQTPLFISTRIYADDDGEQVLELSIIGAPLEHRYQLASLALETEMNEEPVYLRDSDGRFATYTDERVQVSEAKVGYTADVQRIAYDEAGAEIDRVTITSETYEPLAPVYYVGVTQR